MITSKRVNYEYLVSIKDRAVFAYGMKIFNKIPYAIYEIKGQNSTEMLKLLNKNKIMRFFLNIYLFEDSIIVAVYDKEGEKFLVKHNLLGEII